MFSIIICTYNGSSRIERVLDCILQQCDFDKYVDELIVVDNCSTDDTKNIINRYLKNYNKVVYLYEKLPGLSNARLCGVNYCSSEWIIFLDDDNFIQPNWIKNAFMYICATENIGAFNGNVVPKFDKTLTYKHKKIIEACYLGLACSAYSEESITTVDEKSWAPFGAGLVIRTQPLKQLAKLGWLKSEGRKLNQIISGEDSEMAAWVKEKGFKWGFCNDILLYHEIGEKRLDLNYLNKLYFSFAVANYFAISNKKYGFLRKIKWSFIEATRYVKAKSENFILKKKGKNYYKNLLSVSRSKGYFNCIKLH